MKFKIIYFLFGWLFILITGYGKSKKAAVYLKYIQDDLDMLRNNDIEININALIPSSFALAENDLLINFPDPEKSLNGSPAYSIRLANQTIWETTSGVQLTPGLSYHH